ncbi:magnesium transporter MRS2-1-like [Iris pallida]|uniref:Magnesium transporter MRS2-1-like n=1 Tax=Iris pallida TaxID=29817 RepID=A0AAX6E0I5_IRIPA|nr:magnesium transporter MRS2-1-like [Iris pallida]
MGYSTQIRSSREMTHPRSFLIKEYEGKDDDMDGLQSDAEDEGNESDKEMGDDDEGYEADNLKHQNLAT